MRYNEYMKNKILPFLQKNSPVVFDIMVVLGVSILFAPFQPLSPKLFILIVFVLYNLLFFFFNKNRNFGMILVGVYWKENYPKSKHLLYLGLYTLCFACIFYHVFFPLDLLLVNIVFLQVPSYIFRGKNFPLYAAGNLEIVTGRLP